MRSHLITATRYKIVFLKTHTHLSNREIARKVKCSEGTVRYTLKRHRETGEVEERSGRGRKSLLNTQSLKQLDGIIKRRDTATSTELADEMIQRTGRRISPRTIRRVRRHDLGRMGIHMVRWGFIGQMGIHMVHDWPPYTPELNPIEHVWSWMSNFVNGEAPTNRVKLKRAVGMAWQHLPQDTIQGYIRNLPAVCQRIISANGDHI